MAQLTSTLELHQAVEKVFTYFTKPANLVALAMPEFHLELADGPDLLHLGAFAMESRALGIDADHADRNQGVGSQRLLCGRTTPGALPALAA